MLEKFLQYERGLFLFLNGNGCAFWDEFIWLCTGKTLWLPLAAVIIGVLVYKKNWREWLPVLIFAVLAVAVCDQFSSSFIKPAFERPRPTHHPDFMEYVRTVHGYKGGRFGFISSHAANTFGFAMFMSLLFRNALFSLVIFLWASFIAYTRIYLGVHFISDIIFGALAGMFFGVCAYIAYSFFMARHMPEKESAGKYAAAYSGKQIRLIVYGIIATVAAAGAVSAFRL